jgi:hypothetical protein
MPKQDALDRLQPHIVSVGHILALRVSATPKSALALGYAFKGKQRDARTSGHGSLIRRTSIRAQSAPFGIRPYYAYP